MKREKENLIEDERSSKCPNIAIQTIRNSTPRALYSIRMFSTDYQDLVRGRLV